jgi:multidrug resistance efflux pump
MLLIVAASLAVATASCRKTGKAGGSEGIVVIKSPAAGKVRRVLVSEGAAVSEGAVIIEIAVQQASAGPQAQTTDPRAASRAVVEASQKETAEAEADVQRALVDVQRAEQNVASGLASQAELDAARARHQQAQKRLDGLRERVQAARDNLTYQQGRGSSAPAAPREEVVAVRATTSGTVRAISSRVGEQVSPGQPLATMSKASQ